MKQFNKKLSTILLSTVIISSLGTLSVAYSAASTTQEKALSFISNVLPLDMTKYTCTLTQYGLTPPSAEGEPTIEIVDYTLESTGSKLIISCSFSDKVFTGCLLIQQSGSILSDRPTDNLIDSARDFLEKYQTYTGDDLSGMISTLSNADATKNMTTTAGNIKLAILSQKVDPETVDTIFRWTYTVNGADYTALGITFRNGDFYALRDDRGIYKIGNTDVKITKEQAIDLALKYVETYSYTGITGSDENPKYVEISGFNVTKENITAVLKTYPRESSLYPYWSVQLPLKENYPGNVWALLVSIWADSGVVFLCQPLAVGGSLSDASNSIPSASEGSTSPSSSSAEKTTGKVDIGTTIIAAVAASAIAVVAIALLFKKRSK